MASPAQAQQTSQLFMKAGAMVNVSEAKLKVSGDLGKILDNCLADADAMYKNDGKGSGRQVRLQRAPGTLQLVAGLQRRSRRT